MKYTLPVFLKNSRHHAEETADVETRVTIT